MALDYVSPESQNDSDSTAERLRTGYPESSELNVGGQSAGSANSVVEALPKYTNIAVARLDQDPVQDPKQKAAEEAQLRKETAQDLAANLTAETGKDIGGLAVVHRSEFSDAHKMGTEGLLMDAIGAEMKELRPQSSFKIVEQRDPVGNTITQSYQLNDGKTTRTLFVANYDKTGEPITTADFIASKLADGKITPEEKHLIEVNLRAAYRDNANGVIPEIHLDGAFCLGSLYESSLLTEINNKLPASVGKLTAKETDPDLFDRRHRIYEFQGQTLASMDLRSGTKRFRQSHC